MWPSFADALQIFFNGGYVVLDLVYCVMKAIVELKMENLFAGVLIKKRRYWPAWVPGNGISEYFENKSVGGCYQW